MHGVHSLVRVNVRSSAKSYILHQSQCVEWQQFQVLRHWLLPVVRTTLLLMLSHGNTGTPLALHDLATSLARKGFVVVAVIHPGDNSKDHSRLGTLSNLYGRPIQISEAITATLATCLGVNIIAPDQYLSIVVPGRMYREI